LAVDSSDNLYAGGNFTTASSTTANYVAKWDGANWSALGAGMNANLRALAVDSSDNLYAGGNFTTASSTTVNYVARWDGANWSALGAGVGSTVLAIVIDSSDNLYVGGSFTTAGDISANRIAKWNGSAWSALGAGIDSIVRSLSVTPFGNLYAGGSFATASGVTVNYIAGWNGLAWSALGSGVDSIVYAIAIDSSNKLYSGGSFITAGGKPSAYLAKINLPEEIPPSIISISPSANNQNIDISATVSVTFSEDIATSTISNSSFTLRDSNNGVGATINYQNKIAVLHPNQELECSNEYYATLTTGITDLAGNPLASNYIWHFLTTCSSNNTSDSGSPQDTSQPNSNNSASSTQTIITEQTATTTPTDLIPDNNLPAVGASIVITTFPAVPASIVIKTIDKLLLIAITSNPLYQQLIGRIILRVEKRGEAYYVNPFKPEMYYLGKPEIAIQVIRLLGIGITNVDLNKIQISNSTDATNINWSFAQKHAGKIFLQVQSHGEAWYVNPLDLKRYYLATPADALSVMSSLGLGISEGNFERLVK